MAITKTNNAEEIETDDAGVWVTIQNTSIKIRVVKGLILVSAWPVGAEEGEPLEEFALPTDGD